MALFVFLCQSLLAMIFACQYGDLMQDLQIFSNNTGIPVHKQEIQILLASFPTTVLTRS